MGAEKLGKVKIFFDGVELEPCINPIIYPWYQKIKDYFKYRIKKKSIKCKVTLIYNCISGIDIKRIEGL